MTAASPFASLWTLDPGIDYLNHGSFGACPRAVLGHRARIQAEMERGPVRFLARRLDGMLDEALTELAAFLGAAPSDLAFVDNATTGVSTVLRSLSFEPGDELLTTDHAYPACRFAIDHAAARARAAVVVARVPFPLSGPEDVLSAILPRVTPRTRIAALDHVTSATGLVFPLERLVAELEGHGVAVLVDGAHAPGMIPLDLSRIGASYYTGNAHKWLCAPKGAGFLHVRSDRQAGIHPLVISHGYGEPLQEGRSRFRVEFDWVGTRDPSSWLSVPTSLRFLGGLLPGGWPELMQRNHALALRARSIVVEALGIEAPCPESMIGSIASFLLPAFSPGNPNAALDSKKLRDLLHDRHRMEVYFSKWPGPSGRLVRVLMITIWPDWNDWM
jgi:isopenicillin-N epimerase